MSWVHNDTANNEFFSWVCGQIVLNEEGMFSADTETINKRGRILIDEFVKDGHPLETYATPNSALDAIKSWYTMQRVEMYGVVLSVSVEREIGSALVKYGITAEVSKSETAEQRSRVLNAMRRELEHHLFLAGAREETTRSNGASPKTDYEQETIPCEHISHDFVDGKHRIRLHGGRWTKFGVPIYPEVMTPLGWSESNVPLGKNEKKGMMTVMLKNSQPVKVLAFVPA